MDLVEYFEQNNYEKVKKAVAMCDQNDYIPDENIEGLICIYYPRNLWDVLKEFDSILNEI